MKIDWQKMKIDYPRAYEKFEKYYNIIEADDTIFITLSDEKIITNRTAYEDFEAFFDSVGIIIEIYRRLTYSDWVSNILDNKYFSSRNEAKEQAIFKAFEILNKELKNDNK